MKSNRLFAIRQQNHELKQAQKNQRFIQAQTKMKKALQGENIEFNWDMICQFSECFAASCMLNPELNEKHSSRETAFIPPSITFSKKTNWMLLGATLFLILQNTHAADLNSKVEVEIAMDPSYQTATQFTTRSLPSGCENYKLIKGNPSTAKTLLFGQMHGLCDEAAFQCMRALSKGKSKKTTTLLIEGVTSGQHVPCDVSLGTAGNKNWGEFTNTCQGWSPKNDQDTRKQGKTERLREVVTSVFVNFQSHDVYNASTIHQSSLAQNIIVGLKKEVQLSIEKDKKQHKEIYDKYKITHPKVKYENFFSSSLEMAQDLEYGVEFLDKISGNIVPGMTIHQITGLFDKAVEDHNKELQKLIAAPDRLKPGGNHDVQKQNQYLSKSVTDASKQYKTVFVLASDIAVNPNPVLENQFLRHQAQPSHRSKTKESFETNRRAALNLYKDLDQFADENPYAVLSCTLEPDWNKMFRP